jgi:hypothetical protein
MPCIFVVTCWRAKNCVVTLGDGWPWSFYWRFSNTKCSPIRKFSPFVRGNSFVKYKGLKVIQRQKYGQVWDVWSRVSCASPLSGIQVFDFGNRAKFLSKSETVPRIMFYKITNLMNRRPFLVAGKFFFCNIYQQMHSNCHKFTIIIKKTLHTYMFRILLVYHQCAHQSLHKTVMIWSNCTYRTAGNFFMYWTVT